MAAATAQAEDWRKTMTMDGERYVTVDDVAALLGVSPKTVYNWVCAKTIPHTKFGRSVLRFRLKDIEAWAESHAVPVASGVGRGGQSPTGNTTT